jgi:DnaJ-class molecular chaperone
METFTDYYHILGVDARAAPDTIKAAFKKLALQYHPDVYKGEDAEERMRLLLLAYQTLSDPEARRSFDRRRAGHLGYDFDDPGATSHAAGGGSAASPSSTSSARGSGTDRFVFPDLDGGGHVAFVLGGFTYALWPDDALLLKQQGVLRGNAPHPRAEQGSSPRVTCACHRCRHRWQISTQDSPPAACPNCHARDWADYLLLRCAHCRAVFESREIRDMIRGGQLYHPYELFPLCPNCRRPQWCPAENARVYALRAAEARRRAMLLVATVVVVLLVVGALAFALAR